LLIDTIKNQEFNLSSLENSKMSHMLVQQQTQRTPNISIHQKPSSQDETLLRMAHSVDDRLLFYKPDSTSLFHFLQRFAPEPQVSKHHSTSNGFLDKNSTVLPLSVSNSFIPLNESEDEEEEEEDKNIHLYCDTIEPVIKEDLNGLGSRKCSSEELDNISSSEQSTIIPNELDEGVILNKNSSLNVDPHFRRRKRRSSLTRTSLSIDETEEPIITDSIEKVDTIKEEKSQEIKEDLQPIALQSLSLNGNNVQKEDNPLENEEFNSTPASATLFRRRRK
jgi:hypothetical protein